ncbi:TolC family outer membrane protein [Verticiella sediminum]|uniref:TolC family outer membrane protein n=1 Tax=Verticiella sediminum TaxID=1247510 RepID=A0A556A8E5_9BURK|nr:TolC family outer membrane protein [Verticiella sediminum]
MLRLRLAAALVALGLGQSAAALSLVQAYQTALANDPIFASARAQYTAGLEQLPQARSALLPFVTAGASATYNDTRTRFTNQLPRRNVYTDDYGYQLVLSQPLFDWTSWQTYEAAKLGVTLTELGLQYAHQDLMLRVAQTYFDVLAAQDVLTALEAERSAIGEQLQSARRNFEIGTATITDTYEAQARFDLNSAQLLQAENSLQVRRAALEKIIGEPAGTLSVLPAGTPAPPPQPAQAQAWLERAETDNLGVVQAQIQTALASKQVDIARSAHYPQVDLVGTFGQADNRYRPETAQAAQGISDGRARNTASSIGVQVSIPLYTGGYVSSRVREEAAREQAARYDYEDARREAVRATREAFLGVNTGLAQIRALEAAETSSRQALQANLTGYEVGVRINLDVLNAQQQLYATQRDLAAARYNTLLAGLRLKAAAGQLAEDDIDALNRLLRPASEVDTRPPPPPRPLVR